MEDNVVYVLVQHKEITIINGDVVNHLQTAAKVSNMSE